MLLPGALLAEPLDPLSLLGRLLFRFSLSRYPLRLLELGLDPGRLGDESGVSGCGLPGLFEKNFFQLIVSEVLAGSGCSGFLGGDGINNFYALVAIFGVNAAMILFGLVMEQVNQNRESVNWWPFIFGCIVGIIPWIAIVIGLYSAATDNTMINGVPANADGVPVFVYGIVVSLFLLFNCFALNQWLQYRGKGKFSDYLYGEKVYLVLSLVAKSALAWQIFAGTLAS